MSTATLNANQRAALAAIAAGHNLGRYERGSTPQSPNGNVANCLRRRGLIEGYGRTSKPYRLTDAGKAALS